MALPSPDPTEIIVPVHVEDVSFTKREVKREVRVHLRTVNREHLIDEPLNHEKVEIERVSINRPVDAVPPIRHEGDTTVVSVVEEVLVVERRLVLKEEIRLTRVVSVERHRETVTLREQQAVVEREAAGDGDTALRPEPAPIPKPQAFRENNE